MTRRLVALPVPPGPRVLDVLPVLRRALAGEGPALLPTPPGGGELAAGQPVEESTALVITTSGSTGTAKGVLLSASALLASAAATHARLGGPGRWLLALPVQHIAGTQVLVRSLLAGTTPGVLDLTRSFQPAAFAAAAAPVLAGSGPRYTALVPTQLARLVNADGAGLAALRAFDAVLLGGAAAPTPLLERAREAGVSVVTTYGMSETAGGCVYSGVPLDGVGVRLAASDMVELAGPVLALGYLGRPADPAFHDGWFRTGDLGRLLTDGRLEVLGRADDVIVTGGVKVPPARVERVLTAHPGVLEACVLGVPDVEWGQAVVAVVVPVDLASPPEPAVLRDTVRAEVGRAAAPKSWRFVAELPLRGPGKVDRAALRALFD